MNSNTYIGFDIESIYEILEKNMNKLITLDKGGFATVTGILIKCDLVIAEGGDYETYVKYTTKKSYLNSDDHDHDVDYNDYVSYISYSLRCKHEYINTSILQKKCKIITYSDVDSALFKIEYDIA